MRKLYRLITGLVLIAGIGISAAWAETLEVVGFNVESGGAAINILTDQVAEIANDRAVELWGFSEVRSEWAAGLTNAAALGAGANFAHILGTTGGADRLLIVYNSDRLELVESSELHHINTLGRVRAPLVAHLKDKVTGKEFLAVVNHLYRSNKSARHGQAKQLNDWAEQQSLPVIALGDYNFDWAVVGGDSRHDGGFDNMTDGQVFVWVRPATLIRTHCSDRDGVLDFVFVAGDAQQWQSKSEILEMTANYCQDYRGNNQDSDHRPVFATFDVGSAVTPTPQPTIDRAELLRMIGELRKQLDVMEGALQ